MHVQVSSVTRYMYILILVLVFNCVPSFYVQADGFGEI